MAGGALSFREDPFRLTPDRRYIFETDGFRQAFAMLLAGVRARRGAMLLTGPSGTGKTTLLQGLLAKLQQDGAIVFWRFHPDIPGYDLIGSCLAEMEVHDAPAEPEARARALLAALRSRAPSRAAILIVDEAGQFADAQLTELAALPAATGGALQLVLAGLPSVADRLESDAALAPLKNVIALRAALNPLGRDELGAYIAHRCRVAGQAGPLIFTPEAIGRVFDHTGGTPRLVNRLCATALFFAEPGAKQISAAVVDEAARACAGEPTDSRPRVPETAAAPPAAEAPPPPAGPAATPPPAAPQRPVMSEAQSEVHRTLAEAERAWISGSAAPPVAPPLEASAPEKPPSPGTPAAAAPTATPAPAIELTTEVAAEPPVPPAAVESPPVAVKQKRSPALRIAASVALVAASTAALMAVLWPTPIDREYLAGSAPARAVARLFIAQDGAPRSPVVAEAVVPREPAKTDAAVIVLEAPKAEPAEIKVAAALVKADPVEAKPEPLEIKPDPIIVKPEPVVVKPEAARTQRAAAKRDAPTAPAEPAVKPEPIVVQATPEQEPPLPAAAKPEPMPPPQTETAPVASAAAVVASAEPAPAPEAPREAASPEPVAVAEPPSEPAPAVAAALATIAPANGPAAEPAIATKTENPPAPPTPVETARPEPTPAAIAAIVPPSNPPAPPEVVVATVAPPPPVTTPSRIAQTSLPAADPAELQQLMARGDEMMRLGDPASARLFYERAAARGLARAYTAVGRTYDPLTLQRLAIRGGGANSDQALAWYRRGSDAGDGDAARATSDLNAWLARPR